MFVRNIMREERQWQWEERHYLCPVNPNILVHTDIIHITLCNQVTNNWLKQLKINTFSIGIINV